ncbi:uncharacterized protein LOC110444682 [Mizuhopecten yessoensis]|uniref:uncharacterized protein LOC110444682 n=1 Tax=Mizuhopecten yessoensis TaxID=6573 RepID=UPI000B45EB1D|nr:uncharacterized protein LOC110444682 [Mizuhopecten yessoensis]
MYFTIMKRMEVLNFILLFSCAIISLHVTFAKTKQLQCNFPVQWQSNVFFDFEMMLVATQHINASGMFYYDYTNQQMRFDFAGIEHAGNTSVDFTLIWKFNEPAFYTVDNLDKSCEREDGVSTFWNQWEGIPADASPEYFGRLGGLNEIVGQYKWAEKNAGPMGNVAITMDVKVGDVCSPVRLTMRELSKISYGAFAYNYEFLDISDIKSPNVFTPPPNCHNTTSLRHINRMVTIPRYFGLFMG